MVTLDKAALWTDGRYFLQVHPLLHCNARSRALSLSLFLWLTAQSPIAGGKPAGPALDPHEGPSARNAFSGGLAANGSPALYSPKTGLCLWANMRVKQALPSGSAVGIDPTLFSIGRARLFRQALTTAGIRLVSVTPNLVDEVRSGAFIDSRRRGRSSSPARACVWLPRFGGRTSPLPRRPKPWRTHSAIRERRARTRSRRSERSCRAGTLRPSWSQHWTK